MAVSTRDHTLQLGGCEAVAVCQPLITSDWLFLREFFSQGTIYVANTPDGIRAGIEVMQRDHQRLKGEIVLLRESKRQEWQDQLAELNSLITTGQSVQREKGNVGVAGDLHGGPITRS
jgi:hypothetical protein